MRIFVRKLRLHFPDSKHLRCFVCHEIFGTFRYSEIFGLHPPPPPPTIDASYGPVLSSIILHVLAIMNPSARHFVYCRNRTCK